MDLLTNPWVIIAVVLSVVVGNIMALKYTAKTKFDHKLKKPPQSNDDTTHNDDNKKEPK